MRQHIPISPRAASDLLREHCPVHAVTVRLSLSTIKELNQRATTAGLARGELLTQVINAALLSAALRLPVGPDPIGLLAERAYRTHRRSIGLPDALTMSSSSR